MSEPENRPFFRAQVLRLSSTNFFPTLDEGVKELIDCLIRVSDGDQDHARRIIDRALSESPGCPAPADLEYFAANVPKVAIVPEGCAQCDGSGYRHTVRRYTLHGETHEADCMGPCECARGQFLQSQNRKPVATELESAGSEKKSRGKKQGGAK
jgi:hypothetical protein